MRFQPTILATRNIRTMLGIFSLTLLLTGCQPSENPTIHAINQTGGQLQITGSGFIPKNPIRVGVLNAPGLTAPWSQLAGVADGGGNINVTVSYSYAPFGKLPGCKTGDNTTATLNVTGTDSTTHNFGATTVGVPDCEWSTPQVSNHQ